MSHALALVVIPEATTDIHAAVTVAMAPYSEHTNEEAGWWDYWKIGGRWDGRMEGNTGRLDELDSFTIVAPFGVAHRETWNGNEWVATDGEYEAFRAGMTPSTRVVAVDYHS